MKKMKKNNSRSRSTFKYNRIGIKWLKTYKKKIKH